MQKFRKLAYGFGATAVTTSACIAYERMPASIDPESGPGKLTSPIITAVRFTRSLYAASIIASDYKRLYLRFSDYESEEYKKARSVVHERTADRMLRLARTQGAVYVKIGQHLASMNHTIPKEYVERFKLLEDRAAFRPFWQIETVLKRQYKPLLYKDIFSHIDETPVAAASLAQVHQGILRKNNEKVAIKIQYPGLETLVQGDLLSIRLLAWMLQFVFPFFNIDWLINQFKINLHKEVDFELEAQNSDRTLILFENNPHIHVPKVYHELSSKRIIVMDFIDGWRIDDVKSMKEAGIDTPAVAHAVVDAFAQMIFINGHVHVDCHGGNVMVRPKGKKGDFEVFLLDHGLYRDLDDNFRHAYCKLWKGLILRRTEDVKQACDDLGAKGLENVFSIMLLSRTWKSASKMTTDIRTKMSDEEIQELKKDLRKNGLKSQADISSFVERMPEDLWLVFKMNALVRNVNKRLGASVNRFKLNVRYAMRGLSTFNDDENHKVIRDDMGRFTVASGRENGLGLGLGVVLTEVSQWISKMFDLLVVETRLLIFDVVRVTFSWWSVFTSRQSDMVKVEDFKDSLLG